MEFEDIPLKFKKGTSAAFFEDYAVIGDIHLGFEKEFSGSGYNLWDKTQEIMDEILRLKTKKLIMLGDLRAGFSQLFPDEGGTLFRFLSGLSEHFDEVVITKGNHDGGLSKLTSRLPNIMLRTEFVHDSVGFMHGHTLPSKELAKTASLICFGHLHPSVILRDSNGAMYRNDCWLLIDFKLPKKLYPESRLKHGLAFPTFNRYIGGTDKITKKGMMKYAKITGRLTLNMMVI
ncbi:MAG: metallophosphoesterase [Candidatus Parvarchaeota archaeon]|jgi:hypothetical protein|nr:metallophosphoesterase [Candidatus Parvarchaeota archaeon]